MQTSLIGLIWWYILWSYILVLLETQVKLKDDFSHNVVITLWIQIDQMPCEGYFLFVCLFLPLGKNGTISASAPFVKYSFTMVLLLHFIPFTSYPCTVLCVQNVHILDGIFVIWPKLKALQLLRRCALIIDHNYLFKVCIIYALCIVVCLQSWSDWYKMWSAGKLTSITS